MSGLDNLTYKHYDDHWPGPRSGNLNVKTVFGDDPRERYRQVTLKRLLDQANGKAERPLPPFPIGWFSIAFSADVQPGDVRALNIFGCDVVLYRSHSGKVSVLDPYCPHMGAHLGHGGRVAGENIVCPFHAWNYDSTGKCVKIPYSDTIPDGACVEKVWPVLERNGCIFVWYHPQNKQPDWKIRELEEFSNPDYRITGYFCTHMTAHIQDLVENGVDLPHFRVLHKWEADRIDWKINGPEYEMVYRIQTMRDKERRAPEINTTTQGPGYTFTRFRGSLDGVSTHGMTQIEPGVVQLTQVYVYHKRHSDEVCVRAMNSSSFEWASDTQVWENKKTWNRPRLTGDDGPVMAYRKWFNQFYIEPVETIEVMDSALRSVKKITEGHYAMGPEVRREANNL